MKLHLARHGKAITFAGTKVLSHLGRRQARLLAKRLREDEGFSGPLLVSPYLHTLDTAAEMCELLETRLRPVPELRERVDETERCLLRQKGGGTLDHIRYLCGDLLMECRIPKRWWTYDVESEEQMLERLGLFLDRLCPPKEDVLVVGHGGPIDAAIFYLMKKHEIAERYGVTERLDCAPAWNCDLSTFEFDGSSLRVLRVHDTAHLPDSWITSNELSKEEELSKYSGSLHVRVSSQTNEAL